MTQNPSISTAAAPANRLTRSWLEPRRDRLPANLSCGPLDVWPERVFQFGEGNFLRAFADWMFDVLNERGVFHGRVVVVTPTRRGRPKALNAQDGLFTVLLRGIDGGRVTERRRLVTCVSRALNPHDSWTEVVRAFCQPSIRFVVSNTTEAGIAFVKEPHRPGHCPETFPAKVTALLHARFQAHGGDPASGLIFLPCELIDRNGATLREMVLRHLEQWGLGNDFAEWVTGCNHFLNTLVDRIVSGYPRDEAPQLASELGYDDALMVDAECFYFWVIEGPALLAAELPLARAGLNVIWTHDLAPYRTRKVRLLNGAHTAAALAAFLGGLNTVREMMDDPVFGAFVRRVVFDEILPTVTSGDAARTDYARAVLERLHNPFVRHELLSIALNSVSKWAVRVLPSLLDLVEAHRTASPLLSFSLAALICFYRGRRKAAPELTGHRGDEPYSIRDDAAVLEFFERAWADFDRQESAAQLVRLVLGRAPFWGRDLNAVAGLPELVSAGISAILGAGARAAVAKLVS